MMIRVVGIYPQSMVSTNVTIRSTYGEPLGLGKILAIAQECGCKVGYDVPIDGDIAALLERVGSAFPDIVVFSMMTCQFPLAKHLAEEIKKRLPSCLVIAGGYHPSAMTVCEPPFDAYIVGEGESSFRALIRAFVEGRDWTLGPGLLLHSDRTELPERIYNLSEYPWALRHDEILLQPYYGLIYPPPSKQTGFASVEYGRGCKSNCVFCCKNVIWKNELVYRDPGDVVREMKTLRREKKVNLFFFTDLNFTANSSRTMELCHEMKRQSFNVPWFCMSNIDTATPAVLRKMADAGCVKVMFGVESVEDKTLHILRKCGSFEREKKVLQNTLEAGMFPHLFYMIGFPWENHDSISVAAERLCQLPGLQLRIGIATPLPGSEWYWQMQERITTNDLSLFDCENLVFKHDVFTEQDLQKATAFLYEQFYANDEYRKRMERFVARFPRFASSFHEYSSIMKQSGYSSFKTEEILN